MSQVNRAFCPEVMGVPALFVTSMPTEQSLFFISHTHPDPKRVTAFWVKVFLKSSKVSKADLIASARAPVGSPPPPGFRLFQ